MTAPKVAVVVPVHGRLPLTLRFLESFRGVNYPNYEMVVVDDGSPDGTGAHLARHFPWVRLLQGDGGLWWAAGTNKGVRFALARGAAYVLTINNDTLVRPDFLGRLVETARAHPRSIVGSRINFLHRPHVVWSVGGYPNWRAEHTLNLSEQGALEEELLARRTSPVATRLLTGCGTLVPAGCYRQIGLYDARMCPQYHADGEFALRAARAGYRLLVDLHAVVYNDARSTCGVKSLWQRRSPWYWRPLLAVYLRHCPRGLLLKGLVRRYAEVLADQLCPAAPGDKDPPLVRVRKKLRRAAGFIPAVFAVKTAGINPAARSRKP